MAGIYIHIPFCKQACSYCNFHFSTSLTTYDAVITCILREIELRQHFFDEDDKINSIYFGGGTPSLVKMDDLKSIISTLNNLFPVEEDAEITLEVNPEDVTPNQLIRWRTLSINRLSLGIQSFVPNDLEYMNRAHDQQQALYALEEVHKAFANYSIDLIFGSPILSDSDLLDNLKQIMQFAPPHISAYALTIEPRTALHSKIKKGKVAGPEDLQTARQFGIIEDLLSTNGYIHYEVSNYCKPKYRAVHNSSYWQRQPYLGIGPGAHSFKKNIRSWNIANNVKYYKSIERSELPVTEEVLSKNDIINEHIMIGLRTIEGINYSILETLLSESQKTSLQIQLKELELKQYITNKNGRIKITKVGQHFADGIAAELFLTH